MEIPRYCRDCCFHTGETEIYTCAYALLTGRTRKAQPVGEGCTFKIKGERSTQDGMPEDLLLRQKRRKKPAAAGGKQERIERTWQVRRKRRENRLIPESRIRRYPPTQTAESR